MPEEKRYEYIHMRLAKKNPKTNIWSIHNNRTSACLGWIAWDCGWRRYILGTIDKCKFDIACLEDIQDFIRLAMKEAGK